MGHLNQPSFMLSSLVGDDPPALLGISARGRLDGVMLSLTLRQTYRNVGDDPLEVVYTFPLPQGAVLLGLAAEFDGKRLMGRVLPARTAEAAYEHALAEGDAPVLLERSIDGMHTASLGNLKPGETVTLEVRFAQLLAFEQGRLRVAIPTTIAPRYGNPAQAGMLPHQVPVASIAVEYPLALSLDVTGPLARGRIECPTHAHRIRPIDGGVALELETGAMLDRDLVVLVTPNEQHPDLLLLADDEAAGAPSKVALAAFTLPLRPTRVAALSLRLLVDCSGSMGGDSIASARAALAGVLDGLADQDEASLTRFGSTFRHAVGAGVCGPRQRLRLREAIDHTDANLGGTEMEGALRAVFAAWPRKSRNVDVLLITDGEVWQSEQLVEAARRSGHRVFAIGVGSSPAESVLRQLAEATGGAAEFVTPGEAVGRAAARMLGRMRQEPAAALTVDWGVEPAWQLPLPKQTFGGETVIALAGFAADRAPSGAVRLCGIVGAGEAIGLAQAVPNPAAAGPDLARVAAASRLRHCDEAAQLKLALDYQLVTSRTHCVLVHERAEEDRVSTEARLQRVSGMLAAGWGATSRLGRAPACLMADAGDLAGLTPVSHTVYSLSASAMPDMLSSDLSDEVDSNSMTAEDAGTAAQTAAGNLSIPALLRRNAGRGAVAAPTTLSDLMLRVAACLAQGGSVSDLVVVVQDWELPDEVEQALAQTDRLGIGRAVAWLLLALWVASREAVAENQARALAAHSTDADETDRLAAWGVFDRVLGKPPGPPEVKGGARRLGRAMWLP